MTDHSALHSRGLALAALGGLTLSIDIPLIRLADGSSWTILLMRSSMTFLAATLIVVILRAMGKKLPPIIPGRAGLAVAACYSVSSICFISAVHHTSTANLVFILAFNTAFAAILGWIFMGVRPRPATLITMAIMIVGVMIIVGDGIGAGNFLGDMLAFGAAFLLATAITITRVSGKDMGFASLFAVLPAIFLGLFMVSKTGFVVSEIGWIMFNGAIIMPISFFCLALAPKFISGPEVAMFYLLETILAPIWVWMVFGETASTNTLIGGSILVLALIGHSFWQLLEGRRQRASGLVRHPV